MAEYIKREDAKIILQRAWIEDPFRRQEAFDELNSIPSADVAEVRHGKWLWDGYVYDEPYVCNCCGARMDYESNFCSNCGARMEEWMVSDEVR